MGRICLVVAIVFGAVSETGAAEEVAIPREKDTLVNCGEGAASIIRKNAPYLHWLHEIDMRRFVCEPGRETYRAILVGGHHTNAALSFRIEVGRDGRAAMTIKETETVRGDANPKHLVLDRARLLTADQLAAFKRVFDASPFWTVEPLPKNLTCLGANATIIEAVRDGRYRMVVRYCGFEDERMTALMDEINRLHRLLRP